MTPEIKSILIVESNHDDFNLISDVFQYRGFRTQVAVDTTDAIEKLKQKQFCLLLLSSSIKDAEFLLWYGYREYKKLPIVVLTNDVNSALNQLGFIIAISKRPTEKSVDQLLCKFGL